MTEGGSMKKTRIVLVAAALAVGMVATALAALAHGDPRITNNTVSIQDAANEASAQAKFTTAPAEHNQEWSCALVAIYRRPKSSPPGSTFSLVNWNQDCAFGGQASPLVQLTHINCPDDKEVYAHAEGWVETTTGGKSHFATWDSTIKPC